MSNHTLKAFDAELQDLSRKISDMGGLVEQQIGDAMTALSDHDHASAQSAIVADKKVDAIQHEVEEQAILIIARRQPMAVDLREIVGALRIANDLERIGDYAKNIGKRAIATGSENAPASVMQGLRDMAALVTAALKQVLDAHARRDPDLALAVWRGDEAIDAANGALVREVLAAMMEDPRNVRFGMHVLFCAKNIERMGDHATNIAESVYHTATGVTLEERPKGEAAKAEPSNG